MSTPPDTRMSNPQVALICATDLDPGAYRTPDSDARTDRILARAAQFLAFLEQSDADTTN